MIPAVEFVGVSWGPDGGDDILSGLSFSVRPGLVTAICGTDRAGSAALLRLVSRREPPRRGTVRLMGRDIWLMDVPEAAQCLAVVEEEHHGDLELTVRQVASRGPLPHRRHPASRLPAPGGGDARAIDAALARMELTALAETPFAELSAGDRQRVLIARALASEPQVVVLDSPRPEMLQYLRASGLTVIATLCEPSPAVDLTLVVSQGRLTAEA